MSGFDWDDLRVFLAVMRGGSVRAAATRLGISQSTVSRRIEGLETRLGAKLFHRMSRGLVPTQTGEAIQSRAEEVETTLLGIERDVLGRDAALEGRIVISMPPPVAHFILMPDLAAFGQRHPGIDLEVLTSYTLSDLSNREADIAIRFSNAPDDHLVGRRLPDFAEAIYASPAYLEQHQLTGPDATGRWIRWMEEPQMRKWIRQSRFPDCAPHWYVPDLTAQIAACQAGLGLVQIACVFGDAQPGLVRVLPEQVSGGLGAWVLTHADLKTTERVRVCMRWIADAMVAKRDLLSGQAGMAPA
jgi:DNA-binding transcriptional LysR family regulator